MTVAKPWPSLSFESPFIRAAPSSEMSGEGSGSQSLDPLRRHLCLRLSTRPSSQPGPAGELGTDRQEVVASVGGAEPEARTPAVSSALSHQGALLRISVSG